MNLTYLALLCGQQDDLHELPRMAIPIIYNNAYAYAARTKEVVLFRKDPKSDWYDRAPKKSRIRPLPPVLLGNGDLVLRNAMFNGPYTTHFTNPVVQYQPITETYRMPGQLTGYVFSFHVRSNNTDSFAIVAHRLGALDHPHEDSADTIKCGRLMFVLYPYIISNIHNFQSRSFSIVNERRDSGVPAAKQHYTPPVYPNMAEVDAHISNSAVSDVRHDMAVPRDEWKISIIGLSDIHIAVERMLLDEYEGVYGSDSLDEDGDATHRFVDAIDITVSDNTEEDSTDEEVWESDNEDEDTEDTDEASTGRATIGEVISEEGERDTKQEKISRIGLLRRWKSKMSGKTSLPDERQHNWR